MLARTATGVTLDAILPQQWLQTRPLSIGQIARIHTPKLKPIRALAYNGLDSNDSLWTDSNCEVSTGCPFDLNARSWL
jgi:hypothetical protein